MPRALTLKREPETPPTVSIEDAANLLDVPRQVITQLLDLGRVPVIYAGGRTPPDREPVFYTRAQAAQILQVSEPTLDRAIDSGTLPVVRLTDRSIRIPADALFAMRVEEVPATP